MQQGNGNNYNLHYEDNSMRRELNSEAKINKLFDFIKRAKNGEELTIQDLLNENFESVAQICMAFAWIRPEDQTLDNIDRLELSNTYRTNLINHINNLIEQGSIQAAPIDFNANNLANGGEQLNRARFCFDCCNIF